MVATPPKSRKLSTIAKQSALRSFDCLGVTHVCCVCPSLIHVKRLDKHRCADIREEEEEPVLQLDFIMEAYMQFRGKGDSSAKELPRAWWTLVQ